MKKNQKVQTAEKHEKPAKNAAKRGRGRPRHPAGQVRDWEIRVRVTKAESLELASACHAAGQTLTGYVRLRCGLAE